MRALPLSETYTFPALSAAKPGGSEPRYGGDSTSCPIENSAFDAGPPSPEYPVRPSPAMRVTFPSGPNLKTQFRLVKYTLPAASVVNPLLFQSRDILVAAAFIGNAPP